MLRQNLIWSPWRLQSSSSSSKLSCWGIQVHAISMNSTLPCVECSMSFQRQMDLNTAEAARVLEVLIFSAVCGVSELTLASLLNLSGAQLSDAGTRRWLVTHEHGCALHLS